MFTKNRKHVSLLRYWTTRYLLTLIGGLILLGAGSVWWIKETTLENRLKLMEYMAVETADRVGQLNDFGGFDKRMEDRTRFFEMENQPLLSITDMEGNVLNTGPMHGGGGPRHLTRKVPAEIVANDDRIKRFTENGTDVYAVKAPITINQLQTGWVIVMQNAGELTDVDQEYRLLFILLLGLGLLGWIVIYLLTKRILKPIQDVARAAAQVREGDYDIKLDSGQKELEIYELVTSFKEMTSRLNQLEQMRAELLAGVTHDLKTPVTSISGLVQAVRDGVVTGEERQEFLDITLKEIQRLQTMISDLLEFNSLAAGAFTIRTEDCDMNKLVEDIGRQWQVTQTEPVHLEVSKPGDTVRAQTDPLRLQQILINLLNNSYQAIGHHGTITLILSEGRIDVKDTGPGIPEAEQALVFERFFRGEKKKLKVRGLGLGLPFSKMLARSLGAELILKESNSNGTTFSIVWVKET
ncbi:HAMP domain-containing sensor histidine kinase [Mesobacillus subterraneus]|uniref:HAMP domain-containing sensor histidine kinase n=1 Tax=Mesobacillus subterraneus TaxID=285983 RepID=UPI001CFD3EA6|nr:HAMP domain-containing sensor histidine kinase [Mesobacillus subterraneus]WLR54409.1 HAMP domain-containing sensor histidine kinase [Mesobacillus subterraneus]